MWLALELAPLVDAVSESQKRCLFRMAWNPQNKYQTSSQSRERENAGGNHLRHKRSHSQLLWKGVAAERAESPRFHLRPAGGGDEASEEEGDDAVQKEFQERREGRDGKEVREGKRGPGVEGRGDGEVRVRGVLYSSFTCTPLPARGITRVVLAKGPAPCTCLLPCIPIRTSSCVQHKGDKTLQLRFDLLLSVREEGRLLHRRSSLLRPDVLFALPTQCGHTSEFNTSQTDMLYMHGYPASINGRRLCRTEHAVYWHRITIYVGLHAMLLDDISPAGLCALLTVDGRPSISKCTLI